jgi:hypothetical protein
MINHRLLIGIAPDDKNKTWRWIFDVGSQSNEPRRSGSEIGIHCGPLPCEESPKMATPHA